MELVCLASLYQLDSVLDSRRLVEAMSEGFTDQCAGRCMVTTLTTMDLCEQLTALLPGYAMHYDAVGATPVEIPYYQRVSLSHVNNPISECTIIREDVEPQVSLDLHDSCIRTDLSF
jgi:hypothetical protein